MHSGKYPGPPEAFGIGFQHNVGNAQARRTSHTAGGNIPCRSPCQWELPFFSLRQAEKPGLAGTHHYHGISRLDVDCDLSGGTGHIHQRKAKLVAKGPSEAWCNAVSRTVWRWLYKKTCSVSTSMDDPH